MTTVLLIRHGRTAANAGGTLAGRTPGVSLDETGVDQVETVGARLARVPLATIVSSPLERTTQTAEAVATGQLSAGRSVDVTIDERVVECDYGTWTGEQLKGLSKQPLWKQVQAHPSSVTFPGGESMLAMQHRAVAAIRHWNDELGPKAVYAVVSHGDVIKSVVADALGMHLDHFQRIAVDPASVTIIDYTPLRPFVIRTNDSGSDVAFLEPRRRKKSSDAAVGGGAGR